MSSVMNSVAFSHVLRVCVAERRYRELMLRIDGTWIMGPVSTLRGVTVRGVTVTSQVTVTWEVAVTMGRDCHLGLDCHLERDCHLGRDKCQLKEEGLGKRVVSLKKSDGHPGGDSHYGVTVTIWQLVRNGSVSSFRPRMTYTIFASQQTCSA